MYIKKLGKRMVATILAVLLLLSMSSIDVFAAIDVSGDVTTDNPSGSPATSGYSIAAILDGEGMKKPVGYRFSIVNQSDGTVVKYKLSNNKVIGSYDIYYTGTNYYNRVVNSEISVLKNIRSKMDWLNEMRGQNDPAYPSKIDMTLVKGYSGVTNGAVGSTALFSTFPSDATKMKLWLQSDLNNAKSILELFTDIPDDVTAEEYMGKKYILMVEPIYGMGYPNNVVIWGTPCDLMMIWAKEFSNNQTNTAFVKGIGYTYNARFTDYGYADYANANPKYYQYQLSKYIAGSFPYMMRLTGDYKFGPDSGGLVLMGIGERKEDTIDAGKYPPGYFYPTVDENDMPTYKPDSDGYRARLRAKDVVEGGYGCIIAFSKSGESGIEEIPVDISTSINVSKENILSGETNTITYTFKNEGPNDAIVNLDYPGRTQDDNNVSILVGQTVTRTVSDFCSTTVQRTEVSYFAKAEVLSGYVDTDESNNEATKTIYQYGYDLFVESIKAYLLNNDGTLGAEILTDKVGQFAPSDKIRVSFTFYNDCDLSNSAYLEYGIGDGITETFSNTVQINANSSYSPPVFIDVDASLYNTIKPFASIYKDVSKNADYEKNKDNNTGDGLLYSHSINLLTEIKLYKQGTEEEITDYNTIKSGDKLEIRYYFKSDTPNCVLTADILGKTFSGSIISETKQLTFGELDASGFAYADYYISSEFVANSSTVTTFEFSGSIFASSTTIESSDGEDLDHIWYETSQNKENNASSLTISIVPIDLSVSFEVFAIQKDGTLLPVDNLYSFSEDFSVYKNSDGTEVPIKQIRVKFTFTNACVFDANTYISYGILNDSSNTVVLENYNIAANSNVVFTKDYSVDAIRTPDGVHKPLFAKIYLAQHGPENVDYETNKENNKNIRYLKVLPIDLQSEMIIKVNGVEVDAEDYGITLDNITADGKNLEIKSGDVVSITYKFWHNFEYEIIADLYYSDYDTDYSDNPFVSIINESVEIASGEVVTYEKEFIIKYVGDAEAIIDTLMSGGTITGVPYENVWYELDAENNYGELTCEIFSVDLSINKINVYDEEGKEIDGVIQEGEKIVVKYKVSNDCELPVNIRVEYISDSNGNKTAENVTLEPNQTLVFVTEPFVVMAAQNNTELKLEAKVYMDSYPDNAEYETDEANNMFTSLKTVTSPFSAKLQTPNSEYRRDVEVVTSFVVKNTTKFDYNGVINPYTGYAFTNRLFARLELYTDVNKTDLYDFIDCEFVVPSEEETLVWFKWRTPVKADIPKVYGTLTVDFNNVYSSTEYKNNGNNSKVLNVEFDIAETVVVNTPDTKFTSETPYWYGYSKAELEAGADRTRSLQTDKITPTLSWSYWDYSVHSKEFTKVTETASLLNSKITITPENCSAYLNQYSEWIIKSGYGFTLKTDFQNPNKKYESCTPIQTAYCTFPEFGYRTATQNETDIGGHYASYYFGNSYRDSTFGFDSMYDEDHNMLYPRSGGEYGTYATLVRVNEAGQFELPVNDTIDKNKHYIPVWQPDGLYTVIAYYSDAWTPGGMLSGTDISNNMYVHGTMYDDLYFISY